MKSQLKSIFVVGLMLFTLMTFGCTNNQTTQKEETINRKRERKYAAKNLKTVRGFCGWGVSYITKNSNPT